MRGKLVLVKNENDLNVFDLPESRNRVLSKKVSEALLDGMMHGRSDAELVKTIWDDESLSDVEVASLVYALPAAIAKLVEVSGKLGGLVKPPASTVKKF
jgi:hypothetical protein